MLTQRLYLLRVIMEIKTRYFRVEHQFVFVLRNTLCSL